jgi:hypothetical protein
LFCTPNADLALSTPGNEVLEKPGDPSEITDIIGALTYPQPVSAYFPFLSIRFILSFAPFKNINQMETREIEFAQVKKVFSMTCRVEANIRTKPEVVWALLTDARGFSRWNSTVTAIDGDIREGERIRIHVPGTERTFKPKISGVEPNRRMTWSDGVAPIFRGSRTFELTPTTDGSTRFIMEEKFDGIVFAAVKKLLPDFKEIFESYAGDLKKEAERLKD